MHMRAHSETACLDRFVEANAILFLAKILWLPKQCSRDITNISGDISRIVSSKINL